jgi:hypothetical protein
MQRKVKFLSTKTAGRWYRQEACVMHDKADQPFLWITMGCTKFMANHVAFFLFIYFDFESKSELIVFPFSQSPKRIFIFDGKRRLWIDDKQDD